MTTPARTPDDADRYRRPEPSFVRAVRAALGDARTVLEVGSGPVPYRPRDREVTAVDPTPDPLPFADDAVDAVLSTFALDRWPDLEQGLHEARRVARGPVVLLTRDPARFADSWLAEIAPEVTAAESRRWPALDRVVDALGGEVTTTTVPVPFTCVDGFTEAYYARPERLLDAAARRADPAWRAVDEMTAARSVAALRTALEDGSWDARWGRLRVTPSYPGSLVLVVARP